MGTLCREIVGVRAAATPGVAASADGPSFGAWARAERAEEPVLASSTAPPASGTGTGGAALVRGTSTELAGGESAARHGAVAEALRAEPREILVAGLTRAMLSRTGAGGLAVEVEWDGRPPARPGSGAAVGCFLRSSIVLLDAPAPEESPIATVRRVKEAMRQGPEEAEAASPGPGTGAAQIAGAGPAPFWIRATVLGDTGDARVWVGGDASRGVPAVLEVQASATEATLRLEWRCAADAPEGAWAEELAGELVAALRAISDQALAGATETWSPLDFPEAELSQETLDSVLSKLDGR
jgi:hypothetical protein